MPNFRSAFTNRHTILPVIHVESQEQSIRNVGIAKESGCDGVFLINHSITTTHLLEILSITKIAFPEFWIGTNCLGIKPSSIFKSVPPEVDGIWVDNAGIDERSKDQPIADDIMRLE